MNKVSHLMDLSGRRALITGAAGGLGSVFARSLAELRADLILVDRPGIDLEDLKLSLKDIYGISVSTIGCDLEIQEHRARLIGDVLSDGKELNVLVNNAAFVGTSSLPGWSVPFGEQSVETWRRALEVNLVAAFDLCQGLSEVLIRSKGANIVNIASIYGQFGPDWGLYEGTQMSNPAAYGASKAGLIQLTKWLSTTLAPHVRVNAISPGGVIADQPANFIESYTSRTPLGRMANYDDFCGALIFLASDMSEYVTGQILNVDGGWGVW
jgi:NAD(P)-dependent dehydrogenase (short-subunit alcohol dehydrogenase family)